jgi:hypothetical protein
MNAVSIGTERLLKGAGISSEEMQPSQTPLTHTRIHERVSDCAGKKHGYKILPQGYCTYYNNTYRQHFAARRGKDEAWHEASFTIFQPHLI